MNGFYRYTKRCVTLIEMLIVMFLIAMIIGVVAYNYQGSLDEGKAFKTKAAIEKIQTILALHEAENPGVDLEHNWKDILKKSPLVQSANQLSKDGWGEDFVVRKDGDKIVISSKKFEQYQKKNPSSYFKENEEE